MDSPGGASSGLGQYRGVGRLAGRSGSSSLASFSGGAGSGSGVGGGGGGAAFTTGGGGGAGFGAGGAALGAGGAALGIDPVAPEAIPCGSFRASSKAAVTVGLASDGVMGMSGRIRRARAR